MRKSILALTSALALFGIAACSDSGTDETTTQSVNPPVQEPAQVAPEATPPGETPMQPAPEPTAPAQ